MSNHALHQAILLHTSIHTHPALRPHEIVQRSARANLPLKSHTITPSLLRIKLEHIRRQPKLAQQPIPQILELGQHLVLFGILALFDPGGEGREGASDSGAGGDREEGEEGGVVYTASAGVSVPRRIRD